MEIAKAERGYVVSCSVMDREVELMKVRLMVADEIQAKTVREIFLDDPSAIYTGVVELMTHDHIPYSPN